MESNTKKALLVLGAIAGAFAAGKYSVPNSKETIDEKKTADTSITQKQNTTTDSDKDQHLTKKTTEVKAPDGTVTTTTELKIDTETKKKSDSVTDTDTVVKTTDELHRVITIENLGPTFNLMAGVNYSSPNSIIWGGNLSVPVAGPLSLGAWWIPGNKEAGVQAGIHF